MKIHTIISLLAITLAASISDSRAGIIPNRLCVIGVILAVINRVEECRGLQLNDLPGLIGILILFLFAYRFHWIGGGDVKLLFVLMVLLPFKAAVLFIWLSLFFAGLAGIIGFCTMRIHYLRLGPAFFLSAMAMTCLGGYL